MDLVVMTLVALQVYSAMIDHPQFEIADRKIENVSFSNQLKSPSIVGKVDDKHHRSTKITHDNEVILALLGHGQGSKH
jgi:hypothetical protein